jgi:diguanylate cyclase (GGDEF)-like protein
VTPLVAGTLESHLGFVFPGLTIRRAQTVSAAVSAQASEPPDAVLADLAMLDASDLVDLTRPVSLDPPAVFGILRQDCPLRTAEALQSGAQECIVASDLTPARLGVRYGRDRAPAAAAAPRRSGAARRAHGPLQPPWVFRAVGTPAPTVPSHRPWTGRRAGDVDGLKTINDTLGHQAGDLAIAASAAVLRCTFRESDIVARLGGDEFAAVAVDADEGSAARIVERLGQAVHEQNLRDALGFRLSLSIGTAMLAPLARTSLAELLAEADRCLYRKKRREDRIWARSAHPWRRRESAKCEVLSAKWGARSEERGQLLTLVTSFKLPSHCGRFID